MNITVPVLKDTLARTVKLVSLYRWMGIWYMKVLAGWMGWDGRVDGWIDKRRDGWVGGLIKGGMAEWIKRG